MGINRYEVSDDTNGNSRTWEKAAAWLNIYETGQDGGRGAKIGSVPLYDSNQTHAKYMDLFRMQVEGLDSQAIAQAVAGDLTFEFNEGVRDTSKDVSSQDLVSRIFKVSEGQSSAPQSELAVGLLGMEPNKDQKDQYDEEIPF